MKNKINFTFAFSLLTFVCISQTKVSTDKQPLLDSTITTTNSSEEVRTITSTDKKAIITTVPAKNKKEENNKPATGNENPIDQRKKPE